MLPFGTLTGRCECCSHLFPCPCSLMGFLLDTALWALRTDREEEPSFLPDAASSFSGWKLGEAEEQQHPSVLMAVAMFLAQAGRIANPPSDLPPLSCPSPQTHPGLGFRIAWLWEQKDESPQPFRKLLAASMQNYFIFPSQCQQLKRQSFVGLLLLS